MDRSPACRVAIIDDEEDARLLLRLAAEYDGRCAVVAEAASITEAEDSLWDCRPDLVLLDRLLPDGDALDGIHRLRAMFGPVTIIVVSAQLASLSARPSMAAGADGYVDKNAFRDLRSALVDSVALARA